MFKRLFLFGLAAALSSASFAHPVAQSAPPVDETLAPYANPADSIPLPDGRKLHMVCMGKGSPTVILSAGAGDFSGTGWSTVQPAMAKITRTCAWDRPGFGLSDGTMGTVTTASMTADLETALATGGIAGPYVMVGHSIGSFESLLFTDRHPDKVVGMVLVDPSVPGKLVLIGAFAGPGRAAAKVQLETLYHKCVTDLRTGVAKADGAEREPCAHFFSPTWPPALLQAMIEKASNPAQFAAMLSFTENSRASEQQVINPSRNYRDMPLIVLTAGITPGPPPWMPDDQKAPLAAATAESIRGQAELAAVSTRGLNRQVPGADHYIQRMKPQAVIDAVAEVVSEARASRR